MVSLDFYFDVGSPTAFLAYKRLQQLQQQYDLSVNAIPILLGGIFKATGNTSPVAIPAKGKYMLEHDLPRFARRYGIELIFNPYFPINTLALMRGAVAAQQLGVYETYLEAVFCGIWQSALNLGDTDVVQQHLTAAGLDVAEIFNGTQDPQNKQRLIDNTEQAVARGVFGVPTLFIGDDMYFGQDRLDFVEECLQGAST